MSEANRVDLSLLKEINLGVTPTEGNYKILPIVSASDFGFNPSSSVSEAIRSDRQVPDSKLTSIEASGGLEVEFAYGTYDDLLEGSFANSFRRLAKVEEGEVTSATGTAFTITRLSNQFVVGSVCLVKGVGFEKVAEVSAKTSTVLTFSSSVSSSLGDVSKLTVELIGFQGPTGDIVFSSANKTLSLDSADYKTLHGLLGLEAGDWMCLEAQGLFRIKSFAVSGNEVTYTYDHFIDQADGYTSPNGDATKRRVYFSHYIKNGVEKPSYSILQRFHSLQGDNQVNYSGMVVDSFNLSLDTQSILRSTFALQGLNASFLSNKIADNKIKEQNLEGILNSSSDVRKLLLGGVEVSAPNFIQSSSIDIANNARRQNAVGSVGSVGIALGTCNVSGSLDTYFGNTELAKQVINNSETSYSIFMRDGVKRAVLVDIPRLKFTSGSVGIEGINTDLTLPLEFTGLAHEDLGYQVKLCAFPYL